LSAQDIAQLGLHLCSAVGYLHRNTILHLDLKPSNIIATHGMAKVLDLSVARPPGRHRAGIGTTGYMAPEQSRGGELGPATDVWGIGVTLYEVATGEPACDVGDDSSTAHAKTGPCQPNPIRRSRRLSCPLTSVIERCLSLDPKERPLVDELAAEFVLITGTPWGPVPVA
jgi:serine/threonine protein kinase